MTLDEFHASRRRGRKWFLIILAACLLMLALCLAACSPALVQVDFPALRDARAYVPPGKAAAPVDPDKYWSRWLDERTASRLTE